MLPARRSRTAGWESWAGCSCPTVAWSGPPPTARTRCISRTIATTCGRAAGTRCGWRRPCRCSSRRTRTQATGITSSTEVVLFDFGGTLDADGVHWSPRFHAAYRAAGGALGYAAFEPLYQRADETLARTADIRRFGFRQMIEKQTSLLLELVPDRAAVDAGRMAEQFHARAGCASRVATVLASFRISRGTWRPVWTSSAWPG